MIVKEGPDGLFILITFFSTVHIVAYFALLFVIVEIDAESGGIEALAVTKASVVVSVEAAPDSCPRRGRRFRKEQQRRESDQNEAPQHDWV